MLFLASNHTWTTADWVGSKLCPYNPSMWKNKCWAEFSEQVTSISTIKCHQSHLVILLTNLTQVLNQLWSSSNPLRHYFTFCVKNEEKRQGEKNKTTENLAAYKAWPTKFLMSNTETTGIFGCCLQHAQQFLPLYVSADWCQSHSHPTPSQTWPLSFPEGASIPCPWQKARAWTSITQRKGMITHGMLIFNFIHATYIK